MKPSHFSILKSTISSWHQNGFWTTVKILIDLAFIKLNWKKKIKMPNTPAMHLRNGSSDLPVFRQIFMDYEYALHLNTSSVRTIIDGGANIGLAGVYFSSQYPQAKIIGIEPDDANYQQALLNTNSLKQITILKAGLWNKSCYLNTKPNPDFGEWGITVEETLTENKNTIRAITIESIMTDFNFKTIDLLKLDIEGAEMEVFKSGYENWLPYTKTLVIELHDFVRNGCSMQFFKTLTDSGLAYTYSMRGENIIITNENAKSRE